jgi:hypothetical protein
MQGSMHWNVDHCPIAMQLKKPAAVDGPYEAGATQIVEGLCGSLISSEVTIYGPMGAKVSRDFI